MSNMDIEDASEPRRSVRTKKPVERYENKRFSKTRKISASSSNNEDAEENEGSDDDNEDSEEDKEGNSSEETESVSKVVKKSLAGRPRKTASAPKKPAPKPRKKKEISSPSKADKILKTPTATRNNARAGKANGREELKLNDDCDLFNAVRNPDSALEEIAQDWIQEYQDEQEGTTAMGNLITLVLRSCGSNQVVEGDDALDVDGIVSYLEDVEEEYKLNSHSTYPIVSKELSKVIRSNMQEFMDRLISNSSSSQIIYDTDFLSIYFAWLESLSSSTVRAFRHTATVISHMTVTALCNISQDLQESFQLSTRQKEAEEKKARKNSTRIADMEKNLNVQHERKTKCEAFMQEMFDTVFVHRYRDADPQIRHECVTDLGKWMKLHPTHFLAGPYLRYIGWMLSDSAAPNRSASLNALIPLYTKEDHLNQLNNFTDRFRDRMIEIADQDTDLNVRVSAIHLLTLIDKAAMLEEDSRLVLVGLLFDNEARIRKAVSSFVTSYTREIADERKQIVQGNTSKKSQIPATDNEDVLESRIILKCLSEMILKAQLSDESPATNEMDETEELISNNLYLKSRASVTVSTLWDLIPCIQDWDTVLSYLLVDHSQSEDENEFLILKEQEETVVLELFYAAVAHQQLLSNSTDYQRKNPEETGIDDYTRAIMKVFPVLCTKNQMDASRLAILLRIPAILNLNLYLEMKMIGTYDSLWDWITTQFLSQSRLSVLSACVTSMMALIQTSSLNETNDTKVAALEIALVSSLQSSFTGIENVLDETERNRILAELTRLRLYLFGQPSSKLMNNSYDDQLTCSEIANQISNKLALGNNATNSSIAREALLLRFSELSCNLKLVDDAPDLLTRGKLLPAVKVLRDRLWDDSRKYAQYAEETTKEIRTVCFEIILSLGTLFNPRTPLGSLIPVSFNNEEQARIAGFISSEMDRFTEDVTADEDGTHVSHQTELKFAAFLSSFTRAIRAETLDLDSASYILPFFGRLGVLVDAAMVPLFEKMKDDALFNKRSEEVCNVLEKTLKFAFENHNENPSEELLEQSMKLSRTLASGCIQRGAQLKVVGSIDSKCLYTVHLNCIRHMAHHLMDKEQSRDIFKVLLPLLGTGPTSLISPNHASQLKTAMEKSLEEHNVLPDSEDTWDSWRSYEKRLRAISLKTTAKVTRPQPTADAANQSFAVAPHIEELDNAQEIMPKSRLRDGEGDEDMSDSLSERPSKRQRSVGPDYVEEGPLGLTETIHLTEDDVEMTAENEVQVGEDNIEDDVDSVFGDTVARGGRILAGLSPSQN